MLDWLSNKLVKNYKKKNFTLSEFKSLHKILSRFYDRTKPLNTELNDALYLRMRIKEVMKNVYK